MKKTIIILTITFAFSLIMLVIFYLVLDGRLFSAPFYNFKYPTWDKVSTSIVKDCKQFSTTYILSEEGTVYTAKLLKNFKDGDRPVTLSGMRLAYREIYTGDGYCWVGWMGNLDGEGNVIYETSKGKFKKLRVSNFPHSQPALR